MLATEFALEMVPHGSRGPDYQVDDPAAVIGVAAVAAAASCEHAYDLVRARGRWAGRPDWSR
jgi:hypothetical protein